jgi:hypothetical protein
MAHHGQMAALRRTLALATVLTLALLAGPMLAPPATVRALDPSLGQRYEIAATLDVGAGRLDASQRLTLTNHGGRGLSHVDLSAIGRALGYLELSGPVSVDGSAASASWTTTTNLRVALPARVAPGETIEIALAFVLTVGSPGGAYTARLSRENGVISFGWWFPIVSREHDTHGVGDSQISYTADLIRLDLTTTTALPRDAVACPGLVSAPQDSGTRWTCEAELVRDFSFVVNPRFRLTTRDVGDVAMRVYTETVSGEVTADLAETALIGLGDIFGPYPWPDLVLAEVGSQGGYSMEYPRAIHLTREKVTDPYVVYHEVAHQWFYAQIGNDPMLEPWLDEGFADFGARHLMGIGESQCSERPVDSDVFAWPAEPTSGGDWTSCDGYFHTVFYKGTEFITAIRGAVGDEAFFAALRAYIDDNRYGIATTESLLDHLSRSTAADLRPIYGEYIASYEPQLSGPLLGTAWFAKTRLLPVSRSPG